MAVFTEISRSHFERALCLYGLPGLVSYNGFESGIENTTYGLNCEDGTIVVLTMFERRVRRADIQFFSNFLGELYAASVNCPQILSHSGGQSYFFIDEKLCVLQSFVEGKTVIDPSEKQCYLAGGQLGLMHQASAQSRLEKENPLGVKSLKKLLPRALSHHSMKWQDRGERIENFFDTVVTHWPDDLPGGPVHADYFVDNVFFDQNDGVAVIDFFLGARDLFAYDLALAICAWGFDEDGNVHSDKCRAFLSGYQGVYSLSEQEKIALPLLCKAGALRILLTRLIDDNIQRDAQSVTNKQPEPFWNMLLKISDLEKNGEFKNFFSV